MISPTEEESYTQVYIYYLYIKNKIKYMEKNIQNIMYN